MYKQSGTSLIIEVFNVVHYGNDPDGYYSTAQSTSNDGRGQSLD